MAQNDGEKATKAAQRDAAMRRICLDLGSDFVASIRKVSVVFGGPCAWPHPALDALEGPAECGLPWHRRHPTLNLARVLSLLPLALLPGMDVAKLFHGPNTFSDSNGKMSLQARNQSQTTKSLEPQADFAWILDLQTGDACRGQVASRHD